MVFMLIGPFHLFVGRTAEPVFETSGPDEGIVARMRLRSSRGVPKERDVDARRRKGGNYFLSVLKEVFHHLGSDQSAGVDDEDLRIEIQVNLHDKA